MTCWVNYHVPQNRQETTIVGCYEKRATSQLHAEQFRNMLRSAHSEVTFVETPRGFSYRTKGLKLNPLSPVETNGYYGWQEKTIVP